MQNNNEIATISHRALLVCVNDTITANASTQEVYEAARSAWPVTFEKAERAEIVLAIRYGVIVGVFVVTGNWMPATSENFPGRNPYPGRYGFTGNAATNDVWTLYVGKKLSKRHRLYGPIRYIDC